VIKLVPRCYECDEERIKLVNSKKVQDIESSFIMEEDE